MQGLSSCKEESYSTEEIKASVERIELAPGETAVVDAKTIKGGDALATIWSVQPSDLAEVNGNGEVRALRSGEGFIIGSYGTSEVRIPITVLSNADALQLSTSLSGELREEETMQVSATYLGESVTPSYSSSDDNIATISPEGVVTGVQAGTAVITAKHGERSSQIRVRVRAIDFVLPYLKLYNTAEHIIEFERARGSVVTVDSETGSLVARTKSKDFPAINYIPGAKAQVFPADDFVMSTKKFAAFMASQGLTGTPRKYPNFYTYTVYNSSQLQTVSVSTISEVVATAYRQLQGIAVSVKPLPSKAIPYPQLNWNANEASVKAYEAAQGRSLQTDLRDNNGYRRLTFSKKSSLGEYEELVGTYYIFEIATGKLVQQNTLVAPAEYYLENIFNTTSFQIRSEAKSALNNDGFVMDGNYRNGSTNVDVFKSTAKDTKLIFRMQTAFVDGYRTSMVLFTFTALNDPTHDYL